MKRIKLLTLSCLMSFTLPSFAQFSPDHKVSLNKGDIKSFIGNKESKGERKVYKGDELTTIGMPVGGICAGQLYVRGDGTLANWWIANNAYNTGYGIDWLLNFDTPSGPWKVCYQTFEPKSYIDQGFKITVNDGNKTITKELSKKDFDDISFVGEYPIAFVEYVKKNEQLPVKVSAEFYSPFIPLDAKESATPATIMKYTIKNTSDKKVTTNLEGWMQNLVCIDLKGHANGILQNKVIDNDGWKSVYMDMKIDTSAGAIDKSHAYFGNLALSVFDGNATATADASKIGVEYAETELGKKLDGALTSTMVLQPGESKEVTFVLSWYFPNRPLSYKGSEWNKPLPPNSPAIGNMYANWYNSSMDVADQLRENYTELAQRTHAFHDTYYNQTTLPYWLLQRIMMPASTLATETCQWWATDKFWAWEGVGSCEGTCTHVWGYAQAMAALFPELERNLRERTDYSVSLQGDGGIMSRNGEHGILIDGHASVILRMYREHLMSKNNFFLSRNWDKIKRSIQYIINEDGNEDGLIVKTQPNTYDISFNGANTYVGALYLAALRAGEKMAYIMKDTVAADHYKKIYTAGSANTMDRLWNGEYFFQDVDAKEYPKYQYGKGCLSDQLFGQTWASLYRLGDVYPTDAINKALQSIWKFNWTNDVKAQSEAHIPERYYAHSGEPGLFICTWPHNKHPGEDGVRYRDEVWTGIEYQVATEMIERNMVDEGLAIVKSVHSRYDGKKHNPWNEIECGDHYARAMASYGVLQAVQGYWYDGPKGIIGFDPKIEKNNITGFFTAAEGWGNISQARKDGKQTNSIEVKYGRLYLDKLQVTLPANKKTIHAKASINGKTTFASIANANGYTEVSLNGLKMQSGDKLQIVFE